MPPSAACPAGPELAATGIRFPPLHSPEPFRLVQRGRLHPRRYRLETPRGDRSPLVQLYSVPSGRVSPAALGDASNLPGIHRAQQAARKRLALGAIKAWHPS